MAHNFIPTRTVANQLIALGLSWPRLHDLLQRPHHAQRLAGYDKRERWMLDHDLAAYLEPSEHLGEPCLVVVGVTRTESDDEISPPPAVPRQTPGKHKGERRKRGGSGRQWPTSLSDLRERVEDNEGVEMRLSKSGHIAVLRNGDRIATLPSTPSDHRSMLNTCTLLERLGVRVKRP